MRPLTRHFAREHGRPGCGMLLYHPLETLSGTFQAYAEPYDPNESNGMGRTLGQLDREDQLRRDAARSGFGEL